MSDKIINIARDFTRYPGPRHVEDGPKSGEEFREAVLVPKLAEVERSGDKLVVTLDGATGYTSSFLDEAFGGLVRVKGYTSERLAKLLEVRTGEPSQNFWKGRISEYISEALAVRAAE
jgi:STAS-like domain of unknown function (DUF4325)